MQPIVKIFTLSTCGHCKATKKLLDDCKVQYEFTDVDLLTGDEREAIMEEVRRLNERCSFPIIIIGEEVIVGFQEQKIKSILGL